MLNLTSLRTPGVYIDEVSKFPPSIAAVETAIPAFIGYTEKADKIKPSDLVNMPTKIGSLAEYEVYFGRGASPIVSEVMLDDGNNFVSASLGNEFYMYDSLRLFYANGGGDCYIVSAGLYATAGKTAGDFTNSGKGINTLEKVDEPTIILFPDNSLLTTGNDYYSVYDEALSQCGKLMDRVGLLHVKENDANGSEFRSSTGINNLKYGMAYSPWLNVNFPKNIKYRDFSTKIKVGVSAKKLVDLATDATVKALVLDYETVMGDVDTIGAAVNNLASTSKTLRAKFNALEATYSGGKTITRFREIVDYMFDIARKVDVLVGNGAGKVNSADLKTSLKNLITSTLNPIYATLIGYDKELHSTLTPVDIAIPANNAYALQYSAGTVPAAAEWGTIFSNPLANPPIASTVIPGAAANNNDRMDSMIQSLRELFDQINSAWLGGVIAPAQKLESVKHDGLLQAFPLYKTIITGIQNTNTSVPPSGAVAGIYAFVDRTRGVWKAPANVSVTGIIGPKVSFTASELDAMNIDVNAGKSINAIRSFTGKGTLVYGARTLAGNDNEWRYVSVRRFFNMVEESVKKSSEQFVFEPNDANTWVKVQAMIENFLNTLWRVGAMQGAKPEHAYYVSVGLGKTMTPLDVLEGRMIVEIGMAVVRPAEFIILRFSHKMAES